MKLQTRNNVFETNSSSTHAICISSTDKLVYPTEQLRFEGSGEFGWDDKQYFDTNDKANYLWQAIMGICTNGTYDEQGNYVRLTDINEAVKRLVAYKNKIEKWLDEEGIKYYLRMPKVELIDDRNGFAYFYIKPDIKEFSYIDHASECEDFVDGVMADKQIFLHYLFGEDGFILTGNDNDSGEPADYIDTKTDIEFYKGN